MRSWLPSYRVVSTRVTTEGIGMRNLIFVFIAACLTGTGSLAVHAAGQSVVHVNDGLDYAIPMDSPVQFVALEQYDAAKFRGRFVMSGTYHYGFLSHNPQADSEYNVPELYFLPDAKLATRLPYWKQRKRVHEIRFRNPDAFANAIIPTDELEKLRRRKIFSVSGRASIVVDDYQASVECDYPTYSVSFVSVDHSESALASLSFVEEYGC